MTDRQGTRTTAQWQAADAAHFLHPFTDFQSLARKGSRIITRADNIYLWDSDGKKILDATWGEVAILLKQLGRPKIMIIFTEIIHDVTRSEHGREVIQLDSILGAAIERNFGHPLGSTAAPVSSASRPNPRFGRPSEPVRCRVPSGKMPTSCPSASKSSAASRSFLSWRIFALMAVLSMPATSWCSWSGTFSAVQTATSRCSLLSCVYP